MSQFDGIPAGTWILDPTHSEVGFRVRHLMSKVRGKFEKFEGQIVTGDSVEGSSARATIALDSINTGTPDRDNHLRSADFFEVESHPTMAFDATSVKRDGVDVTVVGDLTIKGVTRQVELDVEFNGVGSDPWGGTRMGVEASGQISRKAFGIDFNIPLEGDKVVIGDKITLQITAEAVLQS